MFLVAQGSDDRPTLHRDLNTGKSNEINPCVASRTEIAVGAVLVHIDVVYGHASCRPHSYLSKNARTAIAAEAIANSIAHMAHTRIRRQAFSVGNKANTHTPMRASGLHGRTLPDNVSAFSQSPEFKNVTFERSRHLLAPTRSNVCHINNATTILDTTIVTINNIVRFDRYSIVNLCLVIHHCVRVIDTTNNAGRTLMNKTPSQLELPGTSMLIIESVVRVNNEFNGISIQSGLQNTGPIPSKSHTHILFQMGIKTRTVEILNLFTF